ncbi:hypothetical protein [Nocardioides flavescens]|uniref:Glycosyl hydrolase family 98 putative carbohydrate-binding module domain-containing protein n=1 Tax=Nocardioides flavescens TaxID=2691959 RepID=A0A6L7EXN3_9ACTN|nr:hypothetical protein [Nocardioides flavescens]MXG88451.1 hypothetical protein [Nocardioides flavescens]
MKQLLTGALVAGTALAGLGAGFAPAQAAPVAKARAEITIKVNDTAPEVGDKVKIKGTVNPAARASLVLLQVRYENRKAWKTIGRDRLNGNGRYAFEDKVGSVRERTYRVVAPGSADRPRSVSDKVEVTVYGWRLLSGLRAVGDAGISTAEVKINGTSYPDSLSEFPGFPAGTSRSVGFNLDRDCTQLRGVVGLNDTSPVTGASTLTLASDGVTKLTQPLTLGQSTPVALDVTNVFRLTLTANSTNGGLAAFGTPEVYCSF